MRTITDYLRKLVVGKEKNARPYKDWKWIDCFAWICFGAPSIIILTTGLAYFMSPGAAFVLVSFIVFVVLGLLFSETPRSIPKPKN